MYIPVILATIGAFFGYANPVVHFPPLSLLLPLGLAWLGLASISRGQAFRRGFVAATCAGAAIFYWLVVAVHVHGGISLALALPCPVLLAMILAIFYGLWTLVLREVAMRFPAWLVCVYAGVSWSGLEYLLGWFCTGFPWMTLSAAWASWPRAIQGAAFIGAYALSGVLAALAVSLLIIRHFKGTKIVAGCCLAFLAATALAMPSSQSPRTAPVVAVVQGNIDQGQKWSEEFQNSTVDIYERLTREVVGQSSPALVIWPETALPFFLQEPTTLAHRVKDLAKQVGTPILTGSVAYELTGKRGEYDLFNRAWFVDADGWLKQSYDKHHLVPFGEYFPLSDWLPFDKLVEGAGDFMRGDSIAPLRLGDLALGMLICYEGIFPELAQERVSSGANVLVNISNDAWYGATSAPYQHLNLALMRAVEQRRHLIRSTNTGISAFVEPSGRVYAAGGLFTAQSMAARVPVEESTSFFHDHFALIRILVVLCTLGFGAWALLAPGSRSIKIK